MNLKANKTIGPIKAILIAPRFFNYHDLIIDELTELVGPVLWLEDRPFKSILLRALSNIFPKVAIFSADWIYQKRISQVDIGNVKLVLVINGQTLSKGTLGKIVSKCNAPTVSYYAWDSFKNRPVWRNNLDTFDHVSTFDITDAQELNINYRPLFASQRKNNQQLIKKTFDLSFVGTLHSDRYDVALRVLSAIEDNSRVFFYFYVQAKWVLWIREGFNRKLNNIRRKYFFFDPLPASDYEEIMRNSRAVLDIEHAEQTGLTMRTVETLLSGIKLITTNRSIKKTNLYNTKNVLIIDRSAPYIPVDFLFSEFGDYRPEVHHYYSLKRWCHEVCFGGAGFKW